MELVQRRPLCVRDECSVVSALIGFLAERSDGLLAVFHCCASPCAPHVCSPEAQPTRSLPVGGSDSTRSGIEYGILIALPIPSSSRSRGTLRLSPSLCNQLVAFRARHKASQLHTRVCYRSQLCRPTRVTDYQKSRPLQ